MLMQQAIVVNQEMEMTNVLIGIDRGNKYSLRSKWSKIPIRRRSGGVEVSFSGNIQQHAFSNVKIFERWQ